MSAFDSMRNAIQDLMALSGLFVRTRQVLREHAQAEGRLPEEEIRYLAERTLPYVEAMQQGFRWTLRASEGGVAELRYAISPVLPAPEDDLDARPERGLDRAELACVAAFRHGRVVMGFVPRVPPELATFPDGLAYRDIRPPRGPGEIKDRLEELERGLWEVATLRPPEAIYHGRYRRLYGFFEAGAWLGLEQARLFGFARG